LDEIAGRVGSLKETAGVIENGLNDVRGRIDRHAG
jgi:hypothetical protein